MDKLGIVIAFLGGWFFIQSLKQTQETFGKDKNLSNSEFLSHYETETNLNFISIALSLIIITAGMLIFKYT